MLARIGKLGHHVSAHGLRELADRGLHAMRRMSQLRAKTAEQMGHAFQTLEVGGTSFAFGFARGYWAQPGQDLEVMGIPVDLGFGLLGHGLAFLGMAGRYDEHTHNISDGAIGSYLNTLGLKLGVEQAQKNPPGTATHGYLGYTGYGDAELAGLVSRAAR